MVSKQGTTIVAALALIAGAFVVSPLSAAFDASAVTERMKFKGVSAKIHSEVQENGIHTTVSIITADGTVSQEGQRPSSTSFASILISQFTLETVCDDDGECTERPVFLSIVGIPNQNLTIAIPPDAFIATNQPRKATLSVQVEGFDFVSLAEKTIDIDLSLKGIGKTTHGTDVEKIPFTEECTITLKTTGSTRAATAEGTIRVDGDIMRISSEAQGTLFSGNAFAKFSDC